MIPEKALAPGSVIKGVKHSYTVTDLLRCDGQGYTYKVTINDGKHKNNPVYAVIREHMMPRCSSRGDDGLKVITPDDIAPTVANCLEAFTNASREMAKVTADSPWLIGVLETFAANDTYYYVAEYLDGMTLGEYVQSMGGHLTYDQAKKVLSPIFDAVRTLHRHHVLHTDIHPGHIRFVHSDDGLTPVLFSLYTTLHFSDKGLQAWSMPAMNCEEGFAPPELYGNIDHFYPQVDVYALAATLVFALSGHPLPDSRTITEEIIRDTLPPTIPETIVSALISARDPDVTQRTASVTNFREDLKEFLRSNAYDRDRKSRYAENTGDHKSHGLIDRIRNLLRLNRR